MSNFKNYFLPIISGLFLSFLLFFPQFYIFNFIFLLPFLYFLDKINSKKEAFLGGLFLGFFFSFPSLLFNLWPSKEILLIFNFFNSINFLLIIYIVYILFILIFSIFTSLPYGLFSLFSFYFKSKNWLFLINIPFLWILTEFLRKKILFDLSWGNLGYNLVNYLYLANTSKIWGVYGISFWVILINVLIYFYLTNKYERKVLLLILFFTFFFLNFLGLILIKNLNLQEKVKIAILQSNQDEEFINLNSENFELPFSYQFLLDQLKKTNFEPDIIILPEEVISFYSIKLNPFNYQIVENQFFLKEKKIILEILNQLKAKIFIIGQKTYDDKNFYNSILVFDKNGNVSLYHKEKLFPIIERLNYSKFKNKNLNNNYFSIQNLNFILSSCIEIEDSNLFNKNLKNETNLIINLGSEYSLTKNASKYSLTLARFRAIEQNKFLIKATRNGYSAIISPLGEIIKQTLDKNKNNYLLLGEIYLINGKTLYSKIGDEKILIISFLIVFFSLKSLYIFSQSQKRNK